MSTNLDLIFRALADPRRRAMLGRLDAEPALSVSQLAGTLGITLPAVMKHLDVLADAGLVERSKAGRTVSVTLAPGPLEDAARWLQRYERFWSGSLDRLAAFAEEREDKGE